jgi:hypothetical protein
MLSDGKGGPFMSQKEPYQTRPLKPGGGQDISQKEQTGIEIATAELQAAPDYQTAGFGPVYRLARADVVWQKYGPVFSPAEALEKGTAFPDLYSPYPL